MIQNENPNARENMANMHNLNYKLCFVCSITLNYLLLVNLFMNKFFEINWTQIAAEEVEAVSSISCSGHGRAFLDGSAVREKIICECNTCYGGSDCSHLLPDCMVDADSGDPIFLEPFWMKNAARSAVVISGWHRMSYEFSDGSLISKVLKEHIRNVHALVGNAKTDGKYIIFGVGATHLLNAAIHAFSSYGSTRPTKVVASTPYYPVYKEQTDFFKSEDYKFIGDTAMWKNSGSNSTFIELVTSPNNPDGQLKKAILEGKNVKTIHDLAYYWPHYTPILQPADEDLTIFTLSKLTGHAGSRFGWAIIKDEDVYKRMLTYIDLSTYGVSKETQLRVLKLLKVVLNENENKNKNTIFEFGHNTMKNRWIRLSNILSKSTKFSIQDLNQQYCSFSHQLKKPSPAFAWLKCEKTLGANDCYNVLKTFNISGRQGNLFGGIDHNHYVRLSLVRSEDDFDLLLRQMKKLVDVENDGTLFEMKTSIELNQRNVSKMIFHVKCYENNSLPLSFNSQMFYKQTHRVSHR